MEQKAAEVPLSGGSGLPARVLRDWLIEHTECLDEPLTVDGKTVTGVGLGADGALLFTDVAVAE
jgi:hypothetical protein